MKANPKDYCFSIHHDADLGGFYTVFAKIGEENLFTFYSELVRIVPHEFYPISQVENLYGFGFNPAIARKLLLDKGFTENLDLI